MSKSTEHTIGSYESIIDPSTDVAIGSIEHDICKLLNSLTNRELGVGWGDIDRALLYELKNQAERALISSFRPLPSGAND